MKTKTKKSVTKVSQLQSSNTESKYTYHQLFLHELEEETDLSKLRKNKNTEHQK
jgi:hypothetical protein